MQKSYHHGNLKNELIENGIEIISKFGTDKLSLRALAKSCGVSHNAIYRHFDSKEKMISCCREHVIKGLTEYLQMQISGMEYTNPETIYKLGYSYIHFFTKNPMYFDFLYHSGTSYNIVFTLDKRDGNFPPFEIFREVCIELIVRYNLSKSEGLRRLVKYWSLMQGAVALIISPNVELDGTWEECLKDIFIIGGGTDEKNNINR